MERDSQINYISLQVGNCPLIQLECLGLCLFFFFFSFFFLRLQPQQADRVKFAFTCQILFPVSLKRQRMTFHKKKKQSLRNNLASMSIALPFSIYTAFRLRIIIGPKSRLDRVSYPKHDLMN